MARIRLTGLIPVLFLSLSGTMTFPCIAAPPAQPVAPVATATSPAYRIGVGDTLTVEVLGKPELLRTVTILSDGNLSYPYLGQIKVAGLTVAGCTEHIRTALSKQLASPEVIVTVTKQKEDHVGVVGTGVHQANTFVLENGWRVLDLLTASGGLTTERPEWVMTTLVRRATGAAIAIDAAHLLATGDPKENLLLEPGDVLLVNAKDASQTQVQVMGAVAKQGLVSAPLDGSLAMVISEAGGVVPRAKLKDAVILRDGKSIPVDLTGIVSGSVSAVSGVAPVRVQAGDTLVIPSNMLSYSVMGPGVTTPGLREYPEKQKVTVVGALFDAGGASADGDLKNASLVRLSPTGQPVITPVNLEASMKNSKGSGPNSTVADVTLEPGDVLYVPSKKAPKGGGNALTGVLSVLPLVGLFMR